MGLPSGRAFIGCAAILMLSGSLLSGCSVKVHRVKMDSERLVGEVNAKVSCPHRQGEVVDARPSQANAGGLSEHLFVVEDASRIVREQMAAVGIAPEGAGEVVDVRLLRMYMAQNLTTKIPVVVLSVKVGGRPPFTVRSQKASLNWNGTENEAYAAYARSFDDVMEQLVARLDAECRKP